MITTSDNIAANHPTHSVRAKLLRFLRISYEGEDAVKANALDADFVRVPAGMMAFEGERAPAYHYIKGNKDAHDYIHRSRYPEVLAYSTAMATGRAWSRQPEINGESVREILDDLFADGSDFRTGTLKVLEDYLVSGGGGVFVNLDAKGKAVIFHYAPENVVNWNRGDEGLRLVVFEEEASGDDPFMHETVTKRFVAGIDADSGMYFQERWCFETVGGGKSASSAWVQEGERVYPTMQQNRMQTIPYLPIGDWELRPIFKALAKTARAYFGAYAEYAHAMHWAAMPTPYINFGENGGFYGVDDHDPAAVTDGMAGEHEPPVMRMGSSTPILFRDASLEYASAPNGALSAQKDRLRDLREEIGGLGMRAFNNTTSSQQTAETERLQQSGEGSLVHSAFREVAMAITRAVRIAARWRGISDADSFKFEFDNSLMFGDFDLNEIGGLQMLNAEGYISRRHVREALRKKGIIGPNETDEALDKEISEEFGAGSDFGGGADDDLTDDDKLGAGIEPDDLQEV